jgi:hypothetical protein
LEEKRKTLFSLTGREIGKRERDSGRRYYCEEGNVDKMEV